MRKQSTNAFSDIYLGAIHLAKIVGNFGLKLNGSVRSNRKSFEKISLPLEVNQFSRLDRSDRNGPFHLTIPNHSQSQDLAVRIFHVQNWGRYILHFYGLFNNRTIYSYFHVHLPQVCSCFANKGYVLAADGS